MAFQTTYTALVCVLRSFGGEYTDPPSFGKRVALDRPPAKQALQWLADLRHRHRVHPAPGAAATAFLDGSVAMYQGITSNIRFAEDARDRFRVEATLIPRGPGGKRGSMLHFGLLAINGRTAVPDEVLGAAEVADQQGVGHAPVPAGRRHPGRPPGRLERPGAGAVEAPVQGLP